MHQRNKRSMKDIYEQVPPEYWDAKHNIFQRLWHYETLLAIRQEIGELPKGSSLLDVGCGSGTSLEKVTRARPDLVIYGVDVSSRLVEYARLLRPHIKFQVSEGERLPFGDKNFDTITCLDVVEHFIDLDNGLHEARRVLKDDGRLIILVALESNPLFKFVWWVWSHFGGHIWHDAHLRIFTKASLCQAIEKAGFKIEKIKMVNLGMSLVLRARKLL